VPLAWPAIPLPISDHQNDLFANGVSQHGLDEALSNALLMSHEPRIALAPLHRLALLIGLTGRESLARLCPSRRAASCHQQLQPLPIWASQLPSEGPLPASALSVV
jgi:hypothetical protein